MAGPRKGLYDDRPKERMNMELTEKEKRLIINRKANAGLIAVSPAATLENRRKANIELKLLAIILKLQSNIRRN